MERQIFLDSPSFPQQNPMPQAAYLSLGSNLGDRAANLRRALRILEGEGLVATVSAFYEAEPVDVADQPWFINAVARVETEKTPRDLLNLVLSVEAAMGRSRSRDKGPRNIDIDVLLYGERIVDEQGLKIPHPAMDLRRFVLEPLVEIAPEVRHPILGKAAEELLAALPPGQIVRRIERASIPESRQGTISRLPESGVAIGDCASGNCAKRKST